jgi:hypothetical protein
MRRLQGVSGGLGKRLDMDALFERAGFTKRDRRRCRLIAALAPVEFEALLNQTASPDWFKAQDNACERAARKIIRARRAP